MGHDLSCTGIPFQGESSTGTHQNLAGLGDICKKTGTLLLVDTVCSLGGVPVGSTLQPFDARFLSFNACQ